MVDYNLIENLALDEALADNMLREAYGDTVADGDMDAILGEDLSNFSTGTILKGTAIGFAGDFVVATYLEDDERLELVVVDVSGKGDQAGTRALQLSGAFGGLLGSVGPEMFLASANDYLLRQDWVEGFATAVHLSLLLDTGEYEVRSAGHPPAGRLAAVVVCARRRGKSVSQ